MEFGLKKLWRGVCRCPGWLELTITFFWFSGSFWYVSNVTPAPYPSLLLGYLALLLGIAWAFRAILVLVSIKLHWVKPSRSMRDFLKWSLLPVSVILISVLYYTDAALTLRLKLSEKALKQYAQRVAVGVDERLNPSRRVGLFWISEIQDIGGPVRMMTSEVVSDDGGLVFSPEIPPPLSNGESYRHVYGPWWIWTRKL